MVLSGLQLSAVWGMVIMFVALHLICSLATPSSTDHSLGEAKAQPCSDSTKISFSIRRHKPTNELPKYLDIRSHMAPDGYRSPRSEHGFPQEYPYPGTRPVDPRATPIYTTGAYQIGRAHV